MLEREVLESLNASFTDMDIKQALMDMSPFKASGPDGLQVAVYQQYWGVVGESLTKLVKRFLNTLVVLIPKVKNPDKVTQLRPISLCIISYKTITKTLTNRLKKIMSSIIGPYQSSFVSSRQITDNILIYQEILNTMRRKNGRMEMMVLKIDLEKAYDRIAWDFVRDTLAEIGLSIEWIRNIMACIETTRMSISWDGEMTECFCPNRGLRQGEPISPFIFVMCMERLSHMICDAVNRGEWKGVWLAKNRLKLSHLLFADDMMLFSEASVSHVQVIKEVLDRFSRCSGQKVNLIKYHIYVSTNISLIIAGELAQAIGIPITNDLGRYLGVPSIHGRVTKSTFSVLLDRITARLEGWKTKQLSLTGHQVLAQSILSIVPYSTMQTCLLPAGICEQIDRSIWRFIWGGPRERESVTLLDGTKSQNQRTWEE